MPPRNTFAMPGLAANKSRPKAPQFPFAALQLTRPLQRSTALPLNMQAVMPLLLTLAKWFPRWASSSLHGRQGPGSQ